MLESPSPLALRTFLPPLPHGSLTLKGRFDEDIYSALSAPRSLTLSAVVGLSFACSLWAFVSLEKISLSKLQCRPLHERENGISLLGRHRQQVRCGFC